MRRVESALESLRLEVEPKNKRNFDVLSEGYEEQINTLQSELCTFLSQVTVPLLPSPTAAIVEETERVGQ